MLLGGNACAKEKPKNNFQSSPIAFTSAMMLACLNITEYGYALSDLKQDLSLEDVTGDLAKIYSFANVMRYPSSDGHVIIETGKIGQSDNEVCTVYLYSDKPNAIIAGQRLEAFMTAEQSPFQFQTMEKVKAKSISNYLWVRKDFNIGLILTRANKMEDDVRLRVIAGTYRTHEKPWANKTNRAGKPE